MVTRTLQFRGEVSAAVARCRRGIIRMESRWAANWGSTGGLDDKLESLLLFFIGRVMLRR
jgi:hypothetical protein